jgi:hypothetical protein
MKPALLLFCLAGVVLGLSSCQNPSPQMTEEKMEKFINENLPLGTARSDAEAYLKTLKFGSHSLSGVYVRLGRYDASWTKDSQPPNVHSYIQAGLPEAYTQREYIIFDNPYFMMMRFYFDENEKLIGHSLISVAE